VTNTDALKNVPKTSFILDRPKKSPDYRAGGLLKEK
jgi:hypothetical protein